MIRYRSAMWATLLTAAQISLNLTQQSLINRIRVNVLSMKCYNALEK